MSYILWTNDKEEIAVATCRPKGDHGPRMLEVFTAGEKEEHCIMLSHDEACDMLEGLKSAINHIEAAVA